MKKPLISFCMVAVSIGMIGCSMIRPNLKIGYVDTSKLVMGFSETQKAQQSFGVWQKVWESNIKRMNDSLTSLNLKLKKAPSNSVASKALQDSSLKLDGELQQYTSSVKQKSEEMDRDLMTPVMAKVDTFMHAWGKQHGYSLILGATPQGSILQGDPKLDLTEEVIRDLNAQYPEASTAQNPGSNSPKAGLYP